MLEIIRKKIEQVKAEQDIVLAELIAPTPVILDAMGRSLACGRLLDGFPVSLCRTVFLEQYGKRPAIKKGALAIIEQFEGLVD